MGNIEIIIRKKPLHSTNVKGTKTLRQKVYSDLNILHFRWVEDQEPFWLVAMVDYADSYVYAEFHPAETIEADMKVIK
ncbi:MAG: hypothetical protein ACUVWO_16140 [Thermodesulfobacteriota bacterium]